MHKKFNGALCHSHENGNLVAISIIILDSRSTDCGNDREQVIMVSCKR